MGVEETLAKPGGGLPAEDSPGGGAKGATDTTGENPAEKKRIIAQSICTSLLTT